MPVIQIEKLEYMCARISEGAGLSEEEAQRIAQSLVLSNLMGHDSHGVIRVAQYITALKDGIVHPNQRIKKIRESDASAVVDAVGDLVKRYVNRPWSLPCRRQEPDPLQP